MPTFSPVNRTLLIKPIEEKVSELIPEALRIRPPFTVCDVLGFSSDCDKILSTANKIVVRTEGIEEVKYDNLVYHIIPENFVVGKLLA